MANRKDYVLKKKKLTLKIVIRELQLVANRCCSVEMWVAKIVVVDVILYSN